MKTLIIGWFHHKNKLGLEMVLKNLNFPYKWGGTIHDIKDYELIFMPDNPIDTSLFPNKKFIFGNHFSVFPTNKLLYIKNTKKIVFIYNLVIGQLGFGKIWEQKMLFL